MRGPVKQQTNKDTDADTTYDTSPVKKKGKDDHGHDSQKKKTPRSRSKSTSSTSPSPSPTPSEKKAAHGKATKGLPVKSSQKGGKTVAGGGTGAGGAGDQAKGTDESMPPPADETVEGDGGAKGQPKRLRKAAAPRGKAKDKDKDPLEGYLEKLAAAAELHVS